MGSLKPVAVGDGDTIVGSVGHGRGEGGVRHHTGTGLDVTLPVTPNARTVRRTGLSVDLTTCSRLPSEYMC